MVNSFGRAYQGDACAYGDLPFVYVYVFECVCESVGECMCLCVLVRGYGCVCECMYVCVGMCVCYMCGVWACVYLILHFLALDRVSQIWMSVQPKLLRL